MLGLLWMVGCAVRGPVPPPAPIGVDVPVAQHAGAFPLDGGAWAPPGDPVSCSGGRALVLAADLRAVRLDGVGVVDLVDGVPPADTNARVQAALQPWVDAAAASRVLCGASGGPTLGLALHPDLPWATVRAVLMGVGMAGVSRQALIVSGPVGVALAAGEPPDAHVQVTATLGPDATRWSRPQVGRHEPLDGPLDAALPQLVDGRELGCAIVAGRAGLRMSRIAGELDRLAQAGALRFGLADQVAPSSLPLAPAGAPSGRVSLSEGVAAAFLLEQPRIEATPPDHQLHSGSECSPVLYADVAR